MGKGALSQKTFSSPRIRHFRGRRIRVSSFPLLSSRLFQPPLLADLAEAPAIVHVLVEGKTQTIFVARPCAHSSQTHLEVLLRPHAPLSSTPTSTNTSFGPYVDQIGYYPGAGSTGWVFKVNGVSPPVGADQVQLKDGDRVPFSTSPSSASPGARPRSISRVRRRAATAPPVRTTRAQRRRRRDSFSTSGRRSCLLRYWARLPAQSARPRS